MQTRIAAYTSPTALSREQWHELRDRVVCLVRRTAPGSPHTARMRMGVLCGFLAATPIDADAGLVAVLTVPAISTCLNGQRQQVGARHLANIAAILERLRCTAKILPYRAANTPDPGKRSARQANKFRAEPSEANRQLIEAVCRPRPVLAAIVGSGLTNSRLERIQPHLPQVDLDAHRGILRGHPDTSLDGQVWQPAEVSAQPQVSKETDRKDL